MNRKCTVCHTVTDDTEIAIIDYLPFCPPCAESGAGLPERVNAMLAMSHSPATQKRVVEIVSGLVAEIGELKERLQGGIVGNL